MSKMSVRLDWLSVSLNERLTYSDFCELVDAPTWDEETGEQTGIWLNPWQWSAYAVGTNRVVVSFYKGGEIKGLQLAKKYGLVPTRLDLALDVPLNSQAEQVEKYNSICKTLRDYFIGRNIQPSITTFEGREQANNGKSGTRFWSVNSDKSLSVYLKKTTGDLSKNEFNPPVKPSVRLEYRLKNPHASLVFAAIADGYPLNKEVLWNVWQSLNSNFIAPDIFGLGTFEQVDLEPAKDESDETSGRQWFEVQVLKAAVRWYKQQGEDIGAWISTELHRILAAEAEIGKTLVTTRTEKRKAAVLHQSGQKQDKIKRRVTKAMARDLAIAKAENMANEEALFNHFADM